MHFTSWSCWFRIVSTAIAVLPVERSPMISSRWPRPTFVIESIALIPVWSGSLTGWRWTTPGALNSSGRRSVVSIGPWPSSGVPSESTTRPSSASPTGTDATPPVRRTASPSLILSHSPKRATPTLSSSRLNAIPTTPWSSSSSSSATQFSSPWTRAIPSPSCRTAPTSARFVSTSNSSIRWRRIDVISSGRSFIQLTPCRCELLAKSFEAAADARVQPHGTGLEDDPSDQIRVNRPGRVDLASRRFGDLLHDPVRFGVGELVRGRQLDVEHVSKRVGENLELGGDVAHLAGPALLDEQAGRVAAGLLGAPPHPPGPHGRYPAGGLRVDRHRR